eukprot:scaffold185208_cov15-Tisochrysis_lutea.AAC.1
MFLLAPQLTTPDDLGPVTIDVLMPAGLEPVDPNLSGGGARGCALGDVGNAAWKAVRSWWPICPTQETRPEAVQYHYQSMMAGTHTLEFMAVSVTEGLFILPSAKAFADNQAEKRLLEWVFDTLGKQAHGPQAAPRALDYYEFAACRNHFGRTLKLLDEDCNRKCLSSAKEGAYG